MLKWMIALGLVVSTWLNAEVKVLAFSGSTRDESINKKLVQEAASMARQMGAKVTVVNLRDYAAPFYDGDLEAKEGMPLKAKELRKLMIDNNVIFIATPEYNGSISAVLKNAIDWASRSEDKKPSREAFKGKKFLLMSATPGQGGGANALGHLKSMIENIGGTVVAQQMMVPNGYQAFDAQGRLQDPKLREKLYKIVQSSIQGG